LKRAADLAEAVYANAMPRNNSLNQLSLQQNGSVSSVSMAPFNSYTSQLGVSVPGDSTNSQGWPEGSGGESCAKKIIRSSVVLVRHLNDIFYCSFRILLLT
jgi:hypothetical protein